MIPTGRLSYSNQSVSATRIFAEQCASAKSRSAESALVNTQKDAPFFDKDSVKTSFFADGRVVGIDMETGEVREMGNKKTSEQSRQERYALRNSVSVILPAHRIAKCGKWTLPRQKTKIYKHKDTNKAFYGGLEVCSNVWICPVCAAKIAERRREELVRGREQAAKLGYQMVMLTLTAPHYLNDDVGDLLRGLRESLNKVFKDRSGRNFINRFQILGRIRALEVTWSENNGFHPHFHILLFVPTGYSAKDFKDMEDTFFPLWKGACEARGLGSPSRKHGISVDAGEQVAEYVSKWGLEDEMTKAHIKRSNKGFSMFDLVRAYQETGDDKYKRVFMVFYRAFKRQQQLVWSKGLKDKLLIEDKTDEELNAEETEQAVEFKEFTRDEWKAVRVSNSMAYMLDLAEQSPDKFDKVLKGLVRLYGD